MSCTRTRQLLDAWLDGELDAATGGEIAAHVSHCAGCEALREERDQLRQALRRAASREVVPAGVAASLRRTLERENAALDRRSRGPTWLQALMLSIASAAAAALVVVFVLRPAANDSVREQVIASHVAALARAQGNVAQLVQVAASDRHVVKPWFQGRIDVSPPVRDLQAQGFTLIGARVDRLAERSAAVLVYRIRNHPIELYVWGADRSAPAEQSSWRGFGIAQWSAGGLAFAAVSDVDARDLQRFVQAVQAAP